MTDHRVTATQLEQTLAAVPGLSADDDLSAAVRAVGDAVEQGTGHLEPLLPPAIGHLARLVAADQRETLGAAAYGFLAYAFKADPNLIPDAKRLATSLWDDVWKELHDLPNPERSVRPALVVAQWGRWFEPQSELSGRAQELSDLLIATSERGVETAVWEHQMILAVRDLLRDTATSPEQRAHLFSRMTMKLGPHYERTRAKWILPALSDAARTAVALADESNPDYPDYATRLASFIADGIDTGIEDQTAHHEVIRLQREAVDLTDPAHGKYPMRACLLGTRIAGAIKAGLLDKTAYHEALHYLRQAVSLAERTDPNYRRYVSALKDRTSDATAAGLTEIDLPDEETGPQIAV